MCNRDCRMTIINIELWYDAISLCRQEALKRGFAGAETHNFYVLWGWELVIHIGEAMK